MIASGSIGNDLLRLIDRRPRSIGIGYAATDQYPNVTVCYAEGCRGRGQDRGISAPWKRLAQRRHGGVADREITPQENSLTLV